MKTLFFFGALLLATAAQARPDSLSMTCAEFKDLVSENGAVVVGTGPYIYDRYVANRSYCAGHEVLKFATVKTSDSASCDTYTCAPHEGSR